jgi:uncharacterized protein (TIGR02246 family)
MCLLAALAGLYSAEAAPPAPSGVPAPSGAPAVAAEEDAVRQAIRNYVEALNSGDFKSVAASWTIDGDYADPGGQVFKARKVIEEELAKRFGSTKRPKLTVEIASLRLLSPDVALEDGSAEFTPAGGGRPTRGPYSAVWVKQQGKWLISSLRESLPPAAHRERLTELDWLVGQWTGESKGTTVHVATDWTAERTYLIREIEVERDGLRVPSASQRIGWDPLTRRIKSWTFGADGSHAESFWSKDGDDWLAQSTGVSRDGRVLAASNRYSGIGDGGFTLESLDTEAVGKKVSDQKIHFVRQAAEQ